MYSNRSAAPCRSQHLFLQTNQTKPNPAHLPLGRHSGLQPKLCPCSVDRRILLEDLMSSCHPCTACRDLQHRPAGLTPVPPQLQSTGFGNSISTRGAVTAALPRAPGLHPWHGGNVLRQGAAAAGWHRFSPGTHIFGVAPHQTALAPAARMDAALHQERFRLV